MDCIDRGQDFGRSKGPSDEEDDGYGHQQVVLLS